MLEGILRDKRVQLHGVVGEFAALGVSVEGFFLRIGFYSTCEIMVGDFTRSGFLLTALVALLKTLCDFL